MHTRPWISATCAAFAALSLSAVGAAGQDRIGGYSLASADFVTGATIPTPFTCTGSGGSPELHWTSTSGDPRPARSFAIVVEDPDAPKGNFTHWLVWDLPANRSALPKGTHGVGLEGTNDFGNVGFGAPCPPPGTTHHYSFRLLALDVKSLGLKQGSKRGEFDAAVKGHVVGSGELVAVFGR